MLIPLMSILNEFSPEIFSWVLKLFGNSEYDKFKAHLLQEYCNFNEKYFNKKLSIEYNISQSINSMLMLEDYSDLITNNYYGKTENENKRRKKIVILIFIIWYIEKNNDIYDIKLYENPISYLKSKYRDELTPKGQKELIACYYNIILFQKEYSLPDFYFSELDENDYSSSENIFLDRFFKDDLIKNIKNQLDLKDNQFDSLKSSIEAISKSTKFNLKYLKSFVDERKKYKKLFIITSAKRLPKKIQTYIKQNPHYILQPSSIVNLPKIGLSEQFDIFFFSPNDIITSGKQLINQFNQIDSSISNHPVKIFEIDPMESIDVALSQKTSFSESINFFTNNAINTDYFNNLNYYQILSVLENNNISIKDLIKEVSISVFSKESIVCENNFIDAFSNKYIVDSNGELNIFQIITKKQIIIGNIKKLNSINIEYSEKEIMELYNGKISLSKYKKRITYLMNELITTINDLDKFI